MRGRKLGLVQALGAWVDRRSVEVCLTTGPVGIDRSEPRTIATDVLAILRGDDHPARRGARWAGTCTGSNIGLTACDDGVNPCLRPVMTRLKVGRAKAKTCVRRERETEQRDVRRLQHVASAPPPSDVALYRGLGTAYQVVGGRANCCGILQLRAGDPRGAVRVWGNTVACFAATGAPRALTWYPTCGIQFGEPLTPTLGASPVVSEILRGADGRSVRQVFRYLGLPDTVDPRGPRAM